MHKRSKRNNVNPKKQMPSKKGSSYAEKVHIAPKASASVIRRSLKIGDSLSCKSKKLLIKFKIVKNK